MMYKIINNLLSNAFKFTPQNGHIQLTVNKADRNDKEYIMIEVSDTGCGIDEKDLPHIFERFYQIKDDNAPAGSGIGLHLVKEYARLHNGDITVSSQISTSQDTKDSLQGQKYRLDANYNSHFHLG